MLNQTEFLNTAPSFTTGMVVLSRDGERLGRVSSMHDDYFVIEKGFFFPREFSVRYEDVLQVGDDDVTIRQAQGELRPWQEATYGGWQEFDRLSVVDRGETAPADRVEERDVRVPIVEEELEAHKVLRQKGQIRLRKVVHTEIKTLTVPVRREEVRIERVPVVDERMMTPPGADAFREGTISVPLMEEEVEIRKRPVVREEVRVTREAHEEDQTFDEQVRKEEVIVDKEEGTVDTNRRAG